MPLFDAHCHLQDQRIAHHVPDLLQNWKKAGGGVLVCCGCNEGDWNQVKNLAVYHNEIIPSFGIHPWYVKNASSRWETTLEKALNQGAWGVGEIGLDFAIPSPDKDLQKEIFVRQLDMARSLGRPVSIHIRKAWDTLLKILKSFSSLKSGGLIHAYSGPADLVPQLEKFGLFISFSGSIANPHNKRAPKAIQAVSKNRLLLETDSPDILPRIPETQNKTFNEPALLEYYLKRVAAILDTTPKNLTNIIHENGCRLFVEKGVVNNPIT